MAAGWIKAAIEVIKTTVKNIKPSTWFKVAGVAGIFGAGIAVDRLILQPKINALTEEIKRSHTETERLQIYAKNLQKQLHSMKLEIDALKAIAFGDEIKKEGAQAVSLITYLYATKEFIELSLLPRDENGILVLPEKQYQFRCIFRKVLNGEDLAEPDARSIQEYILSKYKTEIEELKEPDLNGLLRTLELAEQ